MVVWQFTTIAALIGVLLIYVMVLTNRLGTTNALLKRIEEGLVRPQLVTENQPAPEAEVVPVRAPVPMQRTAVEQPAAAAEMVDVEEEEAAAAEAQDRERRVSYLTVRDLKVIARSGRRSSDTPMGVSPLFNEVFGRKHAQAELAESLVESPAETAPHLEVVAFEEPMMASVETPAVVEELAAATYEIRDFLETPPPPMDPVVEPEPVSVEPTAFQSAPTEPPTFEREPTEPVAFQPATLAPVAFEPFLSATAVAEPVEAEPVAAELETAISEFATHQSSVVSHPAAANEDQAPAASATDASTDSDDAAAAREEKRKRDLMMHAYRRRRSR